MHVCPVCNGAAQADLWSIGCVLYEMLVGSPPFRGSNPRELFMNIRSKQLRIPSEVVVSADMLQLLQRVCACLYCTAITAVAP